MPWSIGSSIRVPLPGPNANRRRCRRARFPGGSTSSSDFCSVRLFSSTSVPPKKLVAPAVSHSNWLLAGGGYPRKMSETELSVICKNCGSEVSPYVTECPYCGARLRKRAPKLERRGDALEPKPRRPARRLIPAALRGASVGAERPYATLGVILGSAGLILVQKATAYGVASFGGLVVPFRDEWWRYLSAPFAYTDLGYLFVVAVALAIFGIGLERRLGSFAT